MPPLRNAFENLVRACIAYPLLVLVVAASFCAASVVWTIDRFAINTDTARLISPNTPWRVAEAAFDTAFPSRTDLIVVVLDAATPERADTAASALTDALRATGGFRSVVQPGTGPFFDKHGFLFQSDAEFRTTIRDIVAQQPFLAVLAAKPGLSGVLDALALGLRGVAAKEVELGELVKPMDAVAGVVEASARGVPEPLSWRTVLSAEPPSRLELRRLILVQPVLNFAALQPGADAIDLLRATATKLRLTPEQGVTIRLTGPVPLADEEFATVAEGALFNTIGTIAIVLGLLFSALRSWRLVVAVMVTMLAGLVLTAGLGLALVGEYNLISVAFAVLFVGLGVDFSIQVAVRYREVRHRRVGLLSAIRTATVGIGSPLLLAACSTAVGFLAFLPTSFRGVSELGLIAGFGMIIAFIASVTLLPALLAALRPPVEQRPIRYAGLQAADQFIERHRRAILAITGLVFLGGLPLFSQLRFDSNPMNLRDPRVESVATFIDLSRDADTAPNTIDVIAPDAAAAALLADRLRALPEVSRVVTVATFAPPGQAERLAAIEDAAVLLDTALDPVKVTPDPAAPDIRAGLQSLSLSLAQAATNAQDAAPGPARSARRLAEALDALAKAAPARRTLVDAAMAEGVMPLLDRLRAAFSAQAVTISDLPPDLRSEWVTADGRARLEVFPRGDVNNEAALLRFVQSVRAVAPGATGVPITIVESGRTVVLSFLTAAVLALLAITVLLFVVLRRALDVAVTLVPLVVAVMMSLQAAVLLGIPLNFANIIALPLMCGVSVAYHIYFVMAWRRGEAEVLASSLTRAILYSALTTAAAFGSLWLSSHPGTSSMGKLLTISLAFTLLAAFVFVPALLGPPPVPAPGQPPQKSP